MEEVLRLFTEFTEKAEQSDDLDSPATHQQQTLNGGPQPFENNVPLLLCDAVVELNVSVGDVTDVMNPLLSTPQMVTCAIIDDKVNCIEFSKILFVKVFDQFINH